MTINHLIDTILIMEVILVNCLKKLRKSLNWSQKDLADKSGVAQSLISYIETGNVKNTGIETLQKLALALGVSITELIGDEFTPTGTE